MDHVCEIGDCNRNGKGFATVNDLVRHQMAVHKITPEGERLYRCFGRGCSKPDKNWPRKDNFRSHLRKTHADEDVDELVKKSEKWWDEQHTRRSSSTTNGDIIMTNSVRSRSTEGSASASGNTSPSRFQPHTPESTHRPVPNACWRCRYMKERVRTCIINMKALLNCYIVLGRNSMWKMRSCQRHCSPCFGIACMSSRFPEGISPPTGT